MTEVSALLRLQHGKEDALVWFIDKYTPYVCTVIRYIIGAAMSEQDVEEVASDVFLTLWTQADRVTLVDEKGNDVVTVTCPTRLFGVWSPVGKQAPFVCIEPWYGRCDRVGFNQKLEDREYGNTLGAGESFNAGYEMIFYKNGMV